MKYQVVILAGGESSRFFPFNSLHKSFFKIAGKTVLERTVESVEKTKPSGILLVLASKNFEKEKNICGSNPIFRNVKYICQEESLGQADAILSAREFVVNDFFVINANQFNFHEVAEDFTARHSKSGELATIGITKTASPNKYGIAEIKGGKITGVVEKPKLGKEPSDMRVVGTYLFSKDFLDELSKEPVSDYSLETTLNSLAKKGRVGSVRMQGVTPSIKYPWDVFDIKKEILSGIENKIEPSAIVEKTAVLKGNEIYIGENAHVYDFSIIESPAYIGENAVVGANCIVRGGTVLEKGAQIERYTDVKDSIIGEGTHIHSGFVGDSIIGNNCRIGAEFVTANKRSDRKTVGVMVKGEMVDSGTTNLGVFIGDNVKIGIRVSTMPGTVVGDDSNIYPAITIKGTYGKGENISK